MSGRETEREAGARMACHDCGESGADPWVTTKVENPGRLLRVCHRCVHRWVTWGLVSRDLLPHERREARA